MTRCRTGTSPSMSTPADPLVEAYGRLPDLAGDALAGLSEKQLHRRLDPDANTVAWLVWHLARVLDVSIADAFGSPQVWTEQDWTARFALNLDDEDMG